MSIYLSFPTPQSVLGILWRSNCVILKLYILSDFFLLDTVKFQNRVVAALCKWYTFLWTMLAKPLKTFSKKFWFVWYSAPKLLGHFLYFARAPSKHFLDFKATLEGRFTQHPYVTSQQHYLCSREFMSSQFIIAYLFSVNIHKNRICFFIRKKELQMQGFVFERGGMRKQNLWV